MNYLLLTVCLIISALRLPAQASVGPLHQMKPADFAGSYARFVTVTNMDETIPRKTTAIPTRHRSREFKLLQTPESSTPYEEAKATVFIQEGQKITARLEVSGFKNLDVQWVTEDVLKIEIWLGASLELIELIEVQTGRVLYRTATAHGFASTPPGR